MTESTKIDIAALKYNLEQYKVSFQQHRLDIDNEIYKWRAVKCFQDNWNIDASDFLAMLKSSLAKTANLLASSNFYPKRMLEEFAKTEPETVRAMFRSLFDESHDIASRVRAFEDSAKKLLDRFPALKMTYQDPNSISTYLWLRYPDK